jgi:hypothetical protein
MANEDKARRIECREQDILRPFQPNTASAVLIGKYPITTARLTALRPRRTKRPETMGTGGEKKENMNNEKKRTKKK